MIGAAALVALIAFVLLLIAFVCYRLSKQEDQATPPELPTPDLKLLSEAQYIFLRENGLEVEQDTHDHFYAPVSHGFRVHRIPVNEWGDKARKTQRTYERWESERDAQHAAAEQQRGIEQQKRMLEQAKEKRALEESVILGSRIYVGAIPEGQPKPVQMWSGRFFGEESGDLNTVEMRKRCHDYGLFSGGSRTSLIERLDDYETSDYGK